MNLAENPDYTNYQESKSIGKLEDSEFYWISNDQEKFVFFCTKAQMEKFKDKPYITKIYSAYKK